MRVIFFISN